MGDLRQVSHVKSIEFVYLKAAYRNNKHLFLYAVFLLQKYFSKKHFCLYISNIILKLWIACLLKYGWQKIILEYNNIWKHTQMLGNILKKESILNEIFREEIGSWEDF